MAFGEKSLRIMSRALEMSTQWRLDHAVNLASLRIMSRALEMSIQWRLDHAVNLAGRLPAQPTNPLQIESPAWHPESTGEELHPPMTAEELRIGWHPERHRRGRPIHLI